jgi:leukotriene-A4 hydrolase
MCCGQVRTPKELVALMSSLREGSEPDPNDQSKRLYRFNQPVPMPSYLIAIVVGDLVDRFVLSAAHVRICFYTISHYVKYCK